MTTIPQGMIVTLTDMTTTSQGMIVINDNRLAGDGCHFSFNFEFSLNADLGLINPNSEYNATRGSVEKGKSRECPGNLPPRAIQTMSEKH